MYEQILKAWKNTLERVQETEGATFFLVQSAAAIEEVIAVEKKLGITLPSSFRDTLLTFSKRVEVGWSFSDGVMLPKKFNDIFSGEIAWNLHELTLTLDEGGTPDKLIFHYAPNGDYWALDISLNTDDCSVVYWDHEEDTVTQLADTFMMFLHSITDLYLVGSDIWQMRYFLNKRGLDSSSTKAKQWKKWFVEFKTVQDTDFYNDLDKLIIYILHFRKLGRQELKALSAFDKEVLFQKLLSKIQKSHIADQRLLCLAIGEVLKEDVREWVLSLWKNPSKIPSDMRSYLTSRCLPKEQGLALALGYVENSNLAAYEINDCLKYFRSNEVIQWMIIHAKLPYEGWDYLFAYSKPTWEDIKTWMHLEKRHMVIVINALGTMLFLSEESDVGLGYEGEPIKIFGMPNREEVIRILNEFKETGKLKMRHYVIEEFIENIDKFY
ncbi:SMI1/KNR4 family protein [Bacillus rhizoplanae]|uniref:SMI1/KNR4 family protein n=1 Tax=Bacillus rhizoplanae TaxID=2880966 RepID=UPI003D21626D